MLCSYLGGGDFCFVWEQIVTLVSVLRFVECDALMFGRQITTLPDFYLQVILTF